MFIAFNVIVIVFVLLIAYWWANQGFFSALLHLLCVIAAGTIALAFWEPLVTGLLLKGTFFDHYAWGTALIMVFAISLFVLRLAMDRLAPANVRLPHWANLSFGGLAGACSGVLTAGILIIGLGHIQSTTKLLGLEGWARSDRDGAIVERNALWVPVHKLTDEFYSWLSVTSMRSGRPLRHYTPDLYRQTTLVRDSFGGIGQVELPPSAAKIERVLRVQAPGGDKYIVTVDFGLGAQDFGERLTLSSSQVRLIGRPATSRSEPPVVHPTAWRQFSGVHAFDHPSHYVSSEPGKEQADPDLIFDVPAGFTPQFIQIRGTRYRLPAAQAAPGNLLAVIDAAGRGGDQTPDVAVGGQSIQSAIRMSNSIRPVMVSLNMMPGSIQETDRWLTSGEATFGKGRRTGSRNLRIQGIYEPAGTKCVRLNVSRDSPADIYRFMGQIEEGATLGLVDSRGDEFSPIGYFYIHSEGTTIKLEPTKRLRTMKDLPVLPTTGQHELELLFYVTEGTTITGFRLGSVDVGYCSLLVGGQGSR